MSLAALVARCAALLDEAQVAFGHGTTNAHDEAAWLVLWRLGLPLDTDIDAADAVAPDAHGVATVMALIDERIRTRKPAAYLTRQAWLQGFDFYVDERAIVPRSLIAEVLISCRRLVMSSIDRELNALNDCTKISSFSDRALPNTMVVPLVAV